jgi:hypothetical protein
MTVVSCFAPRREPSDRASSLVHAEPLHVREIAKAERTRTGALRYLVTLNADRKADLEHAFEPECKTDPPLEQATVQLAG